MKTKTAVIITTFVAFTVVLLGGCVTAGPGLSRQENLAFPFDVKKWNVGHQADNHSERVVEFVVRGEKIDNWTELLTMQTFKKQRASSEPLELFFSKGSQSISNDCPDSVWNVIARAEGSILYEWKAQNCRGVPYEHEIGRFLDGKYNRFRIAYVKKVKTLPPEERDKWIKLLSEASIVAQ